MCVFCWRSLRLKRVGSTCVSSHKGSFNKALHIRRGGDEWESNDLHVPIRFPAPAT